MTDIAELLRRPPERPATALRGRVANTPATVNDELYVTIDAFDGSRQQWGPCAWAPSNAMPAADEDCLVLFDEDQTPWVMTLAAVESGTSLLEGRWTWTTQATPAAGHVRLDTTAWASATQLQISETTDGGIDATTALGLVDAGTRVYLQDANNSANAGYYTVTGLGTDHGTYWTFPIQLINSGGSVPANNAETAIKFGSGGMPGPPGPEGPVGPVGPAGPQGPQGNAGAKGDPGPTGPTGAAGPQGPAGTQGVPGNTGPAGPQGVKGDTGATGAQGAQGSTGPQGPAGAASTVPGPQGPQGVKGDTGATGSAGPQGPQGPTGSPGSTGPQGPQGATGPQGPQGATGSVDVVYNGQYPAGTPYTDGDVVIHTDGIAYMAVRPTSAAPTPWPGIGANLGPPGPQGPQGPAGVQGPAGAGVPTVQNGKWLKGSGGAAVWAGITQADLPLNLGPGQGGPAPGKDLNQARDPGWYTASQDADTWGPTVNRPPGVTYAQVWVDAYRQVCHAYGGLDIWERHWTGTWSAWVQTQYTPTGWVNVTTFLNSWTNYGQSYPPARVRQLASGLVVMSGLLTGGSTASSDAFTLPPAPAGAQFIPDTYRHMGGWSVDSIGSVRVQPNGNVALGTPTSTAYFTLDNVVYWPRAT